MIETLNANAEIPLLLRGLCTLGGMSIYLAVLLWTVRQTFGIDGAMTLRQMVAVWFVRVLAACTLASLSIMIYSGKAAAQPHIAAPEIAILILLFALYLLIEKRRFLKRRHIIFQRLPQEIVKITGVTALSFAGLFVLLGFSLLAIKINVVVSAPEWVPMFLVGVLAIIPLIGLCIMAKERGAVDGPQFQQLLPYLLLACFLIMVPDIVVELKKSPEVHEMMHARPRLQRA